LYLHTPYTLQLRTCSTTTTGWEKLWTMPYDAVSNT
jgi:hypothetical protein